MGSQTSDDYKGTIIEESLADKGVLRKVSITGTRVSEVTKEHKTPWLDRWTLHTVVVPADSAAMVAEEVSRALDRDHGGSWYVDFRNSRWHYIVFLDKVFRVDVSSRDQYEEARKHGRALGIPEYQLDFTAAN